MVFYALKSCFSFPFFAFFSFGGCVVVITFSFFYFFFRFDCDGQWSSTMIDVIFWWTMSLTLCEYDFDALWCHSCFAKAHRSCIRHRCLVLWKMCVWTPDLRKENSSHSSKGMSGNRFRRDLIYLRLTTMAGFCVQLQLWWHHIIVVLCNLFMFFFLDCNWFNAIFSMAISCYEYL